MNAPAGPPIQILGCGLSGPAGADLDQLAAALTSPPATVAVDGLYAEPLPRPDALALPGLDVRAELGRKGTSFYDRRTAITVITVGRALRAAGLEVDDGTRHRIGVVMATSAGSVKSSVDYAVETFVQHPPHLVNPALFPNTVMNCAAGQVAIRFGLHGVNATVAGDQAAFLLALRYCANAFRTGQVDVMLAGAVDEFTPHAAWAAVAGGPPAGEGGAVFVLAPAGSPVPPAAPPLGEVLAVRTAFCPAGTPVAGALRALVSGVARAAGVEPAALDLLAACGPVGTDAGTADDLRGLLHADAEWLPLEPVTGQMPAASGAVHLAAVLTRLRARPAGRGLGLLVGQNAEGTLAAAVVRGGHHAGPGE